MSAVGRVVGDVTEAEALAAILPVLPVGTHTLVGPGDDSAVLRLTDPRVVVSTDSMIEGPDFRRAWSTPFDIGWKVAAVNLADIAAMAAEPIGLVASFAAPQDFPLDDLVEIARGLAAACAELAPGVGVVGGDLASAPVLTLVVTAVGQALGEPLLRSGARAGDVIAHAGNLGRAARGLDLLFREGVDEGGRPNRERAAALRDNVDVAAQLRPVPAIAAGMRAGEAGAHAQMDVSDGLSQDAERLCRASGIGIDWDDDAFATDWELFGGEDHGMLAAFSPASPLPSGFRRLGVATSDVGVQRWRGDIISPHRWEALSGESRVD